MGEVYEALLDPIERRVAIKVLLPQYAKDTEILGRLFNEARVVNLIDHPSIVQVSDYGQTVDGTAYLVMELLRGQTLLARIEQHARAGTRLPLSTTLHIAAQLADALSAAHALAVVHRDLKPANIMLVRDPVAPGGERAKVLDFGIAKLTHAQAGATAAQAVLGTPRYMSPEQCVGAGGVDEKTDVYALGVILYELLAGRPPFLGDSPLEYMGQHIFQEPTPLSVLAPDVSPLLCELTHTLLAKNKESRPTMREFGAALDAVLAPSGGVTARGSTSAATPALPSVHMGLPTKTQTTLRQPLQGARSAVSKRTVRGLLQLGGATVLGLLGLGLIGPWRTRSAPSPKELPAVRYGEGTAITIPAPQAVFGPWPAERHLAPPPAAGASSPGLPALPSTDGETTAGAIAHRLLPPGHKPRRVKQTSSPPPDSTAAQNQRALDYED